ncbi:anaphase-promoting complex subunit cdh1-like [Condylostylus longicornis]|uniref:anaphase-promoting complex subunit cdh1-like n=1 Tax=Condylostylus longicornis TaxID=2530218 RepID=UPI00244DE285|nr:anaphase-promoting complex subunit cdh1-like [Condylostylus longicornis]
MASVTGQPRKRSLKSVFIGGLGANLHSNNNFNINSGGSSSNNSNDKEPDTILLTTIPIKNTDKNCSVIITSPDSLYPDNNNTSALTAATTLTSTTITIDPPNNTIATLDPSGNFNGNNIGVTSIVSHNKEKKRTRKDNVRFDTKETHYEDNSEMRSMIAEEIRK